MPTRRDSQTVLVYSKTGYPHSLVLFRHDYTWYHSPKVNGKLRLVGNGLIRDKVRNLVFDVPRSQGDLSGTASHTSVLTPALRKKLETEAYARLRGKLYKGSAALGVTLGSYKQSRDMIVSRYNQLNNKAEHMAKVLGRLSHRNPRQAEKAAAGLHLEIIFGWTPLLSDIHASLLTVCQLADRLEYVRGASRTKLMIQDRSKWAGKITDLTWSGDARVTQAAGVRIKNPNLWLAERAGLLNPATVAWDLVPWSFVVNMFVNVNALVQQVSDFAGLEFDNITVTTATRFTQTTVKSDDLGLIGRSAFDVDYKQRSVGTLARPSLQTRLPDASWETAAMAASLFTQKFATVSKILFPMISTKKGH